MLRGKNAIITGARSGIGKATVKVFAENGANIWACARNKDDNFELFLYELEKKNDIWIRPVYFDMTNMKQMKAAFMEIRKEKQSIDVLVNNAGASYDALLPMLSIDKMKELMDINFFSHLQMTQLVARLMMKNKSGSIINTGSYLGLDGNRGQTIYSATKAAIHAMTKSLAKELAEYNIRVNAVAPGIVNTKLIKSMTDEDFNRTINKSAMKRAATPEEIANVILMFASDYTSYVNGQILRVDGGMYN